MNNNYDYIAELFINTSNGLYDLYLTTFNGNINVLKLSIFICQRRHAGRLYLVSNDIYNTDKWVGSLCALNDISNPFSIRDGDVLFYLPENELQGLLKIPESIISNVKSDLIKILKKKKPDGARRNYINNRTDDALPPTILPQTAPQIVVNNNKIQIAPNLFSNPKTEPAIEEKKSDILNSPKSTEDDIQRVLVRRYIKQSNS